MATREALSAIAEETLKVLKTGTYRVPGTGGRLVDISQALEAAASATAVVGVREDLEKSDAHGAPAKLAEAAAAVVEVTCETSLQAGKRLCGEGSHEGDVCILNFASAKNPGGGFQRGAQAQEESLARSSGLYACLVGCVGDFYAGHRRDPAGGLYSDAMVHSPQVPFFRDDDGRLCEPWSASVITSAAPNAGVARNACTRADLQDTLARRCGRILLLARRRGHTELVLGAFGCGVFRNDPSDVAEAFHENLFGRPQLARAFKRIVFAVPTGRDENHAAFAACFGGARGAAGRIEAAPQPRESTEELGRGRAGGRKADRKAARWRQRQVVDVAEAPRGRLARRR